MKITHAEGEERRGVLYSACSHSAKLFDPSLPPSRAETNLKFNLKLNLNPKFVALCNTMCNFLVW